MHLQRRKAPSRNGAFGRQQARRRFAWLVWAVRAAPGSRHLGAGGLCLQVSRTLLSPQVTAVSSSHQLFSVVLPAQGLWLLPRAPWVLMEFLSTSSVTENPHLQALSHLYCHCPLQRWSCFLPLGCSVCWRGWG